MILMLRNEEAATCRSGGVEAVLLLKILKAVAHFLLYTIHFSLKFVSLPSETKYYYYGNND